MHALLSLLVALTGKIEVSRSFGDAPFKKVGMSAVPDIQVFNISPQDSFLLCGCDGFWSCFGSQDAVNAVSDMLRAGRPLKAVCDRLVYMVSYCSWLLQRRVCLWLCRACKLFALWKLQASHQCNVIVGLFCCCKQLLRWDPSQSFCVHCRLYESAGAKTTVQSLSQHLNTETKLQLESQPQRYSMLGQQADSCEHCC